MRRLKRDELDYLGHLYAACGDLVSGGYDLEGKRAEAFLRQLGRHTDEIKTKISAMLIAFYRNGGRS